MDPDTDADINAMQRPEPHLCSSLCPPRRYLLEAQSFAHGGADPLDASAALHLQADGG